MMMAVYFVTNDKKGVTQKTAWHMLHRLRYLLSEAEKKEFTGFQGTVEIDKAYIGDREGNRYAKDKKLTDDKEKIAVLGIVNCETGKVKATKVVDAQTEHFYLKLM